MSKKITKSGVPADRRPHCNAEEETRLVIQVNSFCPLCKDWLYVKKSNGTHKNYEIAHIYPHSPTKRELEVLKSITPPANVDEESNYIALCPSCHSKYDKGKTLDEYNSLRSLKDKLIAKKVQYDLQAEYKLKADINTVIDALNSLEKYNIPLEYEPKKVDEKLKNTISELLLRNIKDFVNQYYTFVDECFAQLEKDTGNASIIGASMKIYFLEQKKLKIDNAQIYYNMVDWVLSNSQLENREAAMVVVSYFIQHCEVFE